MTLLAPDFDDDDSSSFFFTALCIFLTVYGTINGPLPSTFCYENS